MARFREKKEPNFANYARASEQFVTSSRRIEDIAAPACWGAKKMT
jgi:hypothetical protein